MNQCVIVQCLGTPGPSESVMVPPKLYSFPPNETLRNQAFNSCVDVDRVRVNADCILQFDNATGPV